MIPSPTTYDEAVAIVESLRYCQTPEYIEPLTRKQKRWRMEVLRIIDRCGVVWGEIYSNGRDRRVVRAREKVIVFLYDKLEFSFPQIATMLGRKPTGHSTMSTAYYRAKRREQAA